MKKWIILVLLALFILPSAEAGFGVFGSYWNSKDYDDMFGGGLRLGTEIFSGVGIEGRVSYLSTDLFSDPDITMDMVPIEGIVSWTLDVSEAIRPYVGAGVGYYIKNPKWGANDLGDEITANDCVGYFGLAGVNVLLGNITLFGEAKYNLISEDDDFEWRGSDVDEKYSLDGLSVNAGLSFGF